MTPHSATTSGMLSSHSLSRNPSGDCSNAAQLSLSNHGASNIGTGPFDSTAEISRIMAKIEQDNKILAELDRARSTIGKSVVYCFIFQSLIYKKSYPLFSLLCRVLWDKTFQHLFQCQCRCSLK
jgi:hypothetical protein